MLEEHKNRCLNEIILSSVDSVGQYWWVCFVVIDGIF